MLPFVFATEKDFVVTEKLPSYSFINQLKDWGFKVPVFCSLTELESMPAGSFEAIYPWGWSPAAHFKLKNLKEKCSVEFKRNPAFNWQPNHKLLFERSSSLNFLSDILNKYPHYKFIKKSLTGVIVKSIDEIESLLIVNHNMVLKAPLSSSGRGIQIIRSQILNQSNKAWISGVLKQQGYLIAECYLDKLADLSFQFRITERKEVEYLGYTFFESNSNGQYKGTWINYDLNELIPESEFDELSDMIRNTAKIIGERLKSTVYTSWHRGFLGVDAMVFRVDGRLTIQPCIEINCRMNMGILTLLLQEHILKDCKGKLEMYYGPAGDFNIFVKRELERNPPVIQDGKILSGFFSLVEPSIHQKFGAYISVAGTR